MQTLIVNGRPIRNTPLANAVQRGYRQQLMIGRFPFFVIAMHLPHAAVDVNVHPQKLQVRFVQEDTLCQMLEKTVVDSLYAFYHPPLVDDLTKDEENTDTQALEKQTVDNQTSVDASIGKEDAGEEKTSFAALQESLTAYRAQMPPMDHTITCLLYTSRSV